MNTEEEEEEEGKSPMKGAVAKKLLAERRSCLIESKTE